MTYKRVLLKLSGEALMGEKPYGIDPAIVQSIAEDVSQVVAKNVQLAIVVGGGNIFRGLKGSADGMDRATADYVGMLATVMNAISLQDGLERVGVATRVQTAIEMQEIAEPYIRRRAMRHLEKGRVVVFGVYNCDPNKFQEAKKYSSLSYQQVLSDEIAVMDSTAIALCKDNNIPIMVFDIFKKGNISKAVAGEPIGSLIS